jgi:hydrogenase maturation protein HypF
MWLERLARRSPETESYPFPYSGGNLDFRPLLGAVVEDRVRGRDVCEIARAFHRGIALGVRDALMQLRSTYDTDTVVLSGGVFQNQLLLGDLKTLLERDSFVIWTNHAVPANDGGISLGQAALAAFDAAEVFGFLEEQDSKCAERAA